MKKLLVIGFILLSVACEDPREKQKFLKEMADAGFIYQQCKGRYGGFYRWVKKEDITLPCTGR